MSAGTGAALGATGATGAAGALAYTGLSALVYSLDALALILLGLLVVRLAAVEYGQPTTSNEEKARSG